MRYLIALLIFIASCAPAKSDSGGAAGMQVTQLTAPDGTTCYALIDGNGHPFGGNCK